MPVLFATFLSVSLALAQVQAQNPINPGPPQKFKEVKAKDVKTEVVIELYHENRELIGPCFSVYITGWAPNDSIEVFALNDKKEKVEIAAGDKCFPVSSEGMCSFSVPYDFHAFKPGHWLIAVSGKPGVHGHYVDIPAPSEKK